jgi:hypothetical protein
MPRDRDLSHFKMANLTFQATDSLLPTLNCMERSPQLGHPAIICCMLTIELLTQLL